MELIDTKHVKTASLLTAEIGLESAEFHVFLNNFIGSRDILSQLSYLVFLKNIGG